MALIATEQKQHLALLLSENDQRQSADEFLQTGIKQGFLGSAMLGGAMWLITPHYFYITMAALAGLCTPITFHYFHLLLSFESRKRQKESMVADLLLQASVFPSGTPTMTFLLYCARSDFGLLGREFQKAVFEIKKGARIESALQNIKARCQSRTVGRAIELILLGYRTGSDLSQTFRQTAEDLLETNTILRERNAVLLVEKYTILLAGGVLVPVVLGLLTGMVASLDFSSFEKLEIGLPEPAREELRMFSFWGTQLYLIEYALIAGFFVANQEGNWKKGIVYAAVLVPLGLTAFWLARGF